MKSYEYVIFVIFEYNMINILYYLIIKKIFRNISYEIILKYNMIRYFCDKLYIELYMKKIKKI